MVTDTNSDGRGQQYTPGTTRGSPFVTSQNYQKNVNTNEQDERCFLWKILRSRHTEYATMVLIVALLWILLYIIFRDEVMPPNGGLFSMFFLLVCSIIAGRIAAIFRLPPLLGMLLCGIILANTNLYKSQGVYAQIVSRLRGAALTVILIKGGLGLDSDVLFKNSITVIKLAIIPCLGEACATAVASHFILDLPWIWGLSLGFVLSAVSPAVVVTSLLRLKKEGWGEDKGIATLIIAASNIDDVFCISIFGILIAVLFAEGDLISSIIRGPLELAIGMSSGVLLGLITAFLPSCNESHVSIKRSLIMAVCSLAFILGTPILDLPGAGPLAAIVSSFIANTYWKKHEYKTGRNPVAASFSGAWVIMEPLLFGLVGAEINLHHLTLELFVKGCGILAFCLSVRMISCWIAILGCGMSVKEMLFINLAWLPKATVQAALGPILLDRLHENHIADPQMINYATSVLSIAVLSILITAPIGAIGISVCGPKLLNRKMKEPIPEVNAAYELDFGEDDVNNGSRL